MLLTKLATPMAVVAVVAVADFGEKVRGNDERTNRRELNKKKKILLLNLIY